MNKKLIIASNNYQKTQDLKSILEPIIGIEVVSQMQFNVPEAEETGSTFVENAILKARNACKYTNMPALADDSGLEVDALDKRPGVFSARYAGHETTYAEKIEKLLHELRDVPKPLRTARFQCVIVMLESVSDPTPIICHGTWEGEIALAPAGINGFGYAPIFWLPEHQCTVAELSSEVRNQISHRARALHMFNNTPSKQLH